MSCFAPRTTHVNAFHEPRTQLSIASTTSSFDGHLSTKAAQKDLSTFFRAVPTRAVNAFHDPSKPPHYYSSPSHAHQTLSDRKALDELDDYFNKLPAHDVNAYHDGSAGHFAKARGLSTANADSDISSYYDSVPAHLVGANHEPNMGQASGHLSLRQSAKPNKVTASSDKPPADKTVAAKTRGAPKVGTGIKAAVPTIMRAATKLIKTRSGHQPYRDTKISIIQDWGPDADAPTVASLSSYKTTQKLFDTRLNFSLSLHGHDFVRQCASKERTIRHPTRRDAKTMNSIVRFCP